MSARYDERGKFTPDIIQKEDVPVVIQTMTNIIRGKIHILPGLRTKDQLNQFEQFFTVTDASVYNPAGKEIFRCKFMLVGLDKTVWVIPEEGIEKTSE